MAEKSEGEISDSEEEESATPEPKIAPPAKRIKNVEVSRNESRFPNLTATLRKKRVKKSKREKRALAKRARKFKESWNGCDSMTTSSLANTCLDSAHFSILAQLVGILNPLSPLSSNLSSEPSDVINSVPLSTNNLQMYKTAKLQGVILHLLLGLPWLEAPIEGLDELCSHRLAVIWLSMVSAELFLSNSELFTGLKSFTPCVQFLLHHPGSASYAKLGLESFMFMSETDEGGGRGGGMERADTQTQSSGVERTECLLSHYDMKLNDFPLPPHSTNSTSSTDTSQYIRLCEEWPVSVQAVNSSPMFALDCEMVETKAGLELARVSLVNEDLECIYDKLVKPENPVLDYKTQYSGITEELLHDISTTHSDVQRELVHLLPVVCILVGHSLENDLHALKMTHPYIIDTSCLFLSHVNHRYKPKLRLLAKRFLGVDIQTGGGGHSSVQDARACMQLVLKRLREGAKMSLSGRGHSILTEVASFNHSVATVDRPSIVSLFGPLTSRYPVTGDEDVVREAGEAIAEHDLTFLQLHSYEDHLKTSSGGCQHMSERVLRQLDAEVVDIVTSCPSGTLVVVVCGSSDIRAMKRLQQRQQRERLREVVAVARTGLVHAFIVR